MTDNDKTDKPKRLKIILLTDTERESLRESLRFKQAVAVRDVPATTAIAVIEILEWLVDSEDPIEVVDALEAMRQAIALLRGETHA